MSDDITTDPNLGGRFSSKVTPSRWDPSYSDVEVTDNETGDSLKGFLRPEDDRSAVEEQLAKDILETHKIVNTEPDVRRFNVPEATEEAYEVNDSPVENAAEGDA